MFDRTKLARKAALKRGKKNTKLKHEIGQSSHHRSPKCNKNFSHQNRPFLHRASSCAPTLTFPLVYVLLSIFFYFYAPLSDADTTRSYAVTHNTKKTTTTTTTLVVCCEFACATPFLTHTLTSSGRFSRSNTNNILLFSQ